MPPLRTGTHRATHRAIGPFDVPLRQLLLLVGFNGYMHMGVFLVVVPLLARDVYHMSMAQYAAVQLLFVLGMMSAHLGLYIKKDDAHPGQGAVFADHAIARHRNDDGEWWSRCGLALVAQLVWLF